jgi:hypothetical protein
VQDVEPSSEDRFTKLGIATNVDCVCKTSSCLTIMAGPELKEPLRGCNMRLLGPWSQRSQEEKLEMHPLKRHCHHRQHRQQTQQEEAAEDVTPPDSTGRTSHTTSGINGQNSAGGESENDERIKASG